MLLLLDIGNSRCKWVLVQKGVWLQQGVADIAEWAVLQQAWSALPKPSCVVVSNVAGEAIAQRLREVCVDSKWPLQFLVAGMAQSGVRNGYQQPERLGSDRWAGLIAAWHHVQGACLVVSCGTATTIDALSAQGEFLGGLILPGMNLMQHSLTTGTAQLKAEQDQGRVQDFPQNTADAIQSGILRATVGAITHQRDLLRTQYGEVHCLLAGGAASKLQPYINFPFEHEEALVLKGLQIIGESKP